MCVAVASHVARAEQEQGRLSTPAGAATPACGAHTYSHSTGDPGSIISGTPDSKISGTPDKLFLGSIVSTHRLFNYFMRSETDMRKKKKKLENK